jgi:hypothetical protein
MKTIISALVFAAMATPVLAQGDYYICEVDSVEYFVNDAVDLDRTSQVQQQYLDIEFDISVAEVAAGLEGPEGAFVHDRTLPNGDYVFTEIDLDLNMWITVQVMSVSENNWVVATGHCE